MKLRNILLIKPVNQHSAIKMCFQDFLPNSIEGKLFGNYNFGIQNEQCVISYCFTN